MFIRSFYCHQKNFKYVIKSLARHSETGEIFIVYESFSLIYDSSLTSLKNKNNSEIWIKPLLNFKKNLIYNDIVEFEKLTKIN